ncbi:34775_t:CDS:1, partial [Racocetra persica]
DKYTLSTLKKQAKNIGNKILSNFKENIKDIYHKFDQVSLETLEFSVNENNYYIEFDAKNE